MIAKSPRFAAYRSWLFLLISAPLLSLYFRNETAFPYLLVGVYSLIGLGWGLVINKPPRRMPWWLLAGGIALWVLGDLVWFLPGPDGPASYPSPADAVYLVGYPLMILALGLLLWEKADRNSSALVDAAMIMIGIGTLVWMQGIAPAFEGETAASITVSVTYLLLDLLLVGLAARLALTGRARTPSSILLSIGLLTLTLSDLASYVLTTESEILWDLVDAGWLLSYLSLGAAALHPSMARKPDRTSEVSERLSFTRLVVMAAGGLVAPLALLPDILDDHEITLLGPLLGSIIFFALIFVRLRGLVRSLEGVNRRLSEQGKRLQEAERRYRTLVEHNPAVSYVAAVSKEQVRLLYVSPQIKDVLGYEPQELVHEPSRWMKIVHPDDLPGLLGEDADSTATQVDRSFRLIAKDGSTVWASNRVSLISEESGEQRWQGIFLDISDRFRVEELESALEREREIVAKLRSLDEMKNAFLQAVSHELRTPLTSIKGLGATMQLRLEDLTHEEIADLIARINTNAGRLENLLEDLLDVDRLSRGVFVPSYVTTDVGSIVERIAERLRPSALQTIVVDCHPVRARTDPPKVERIVENLISNAIKHTPAECSIWIKVTTDGENVLIAVEDSGLGVRDDKKETIFEPFGQWASEASHSQGLGLGLSLVQKFSELLEGRAWVEDRLGGGASFKVSLPVTPRGRVEATNALPGMPAEEVESR